MNNVMESVSSDIFGDETASKREIKFSYLEVCGDVCTDCLVDNAEVGGIQIGEMLDGSVKTRNLTTHVCSSIEELARLVELAKSKRKTDATERNEQVGARGVILRG